MSPFFRHTDAMRSTTSSSTNGASISAHDEWDYLGASAASGSAMTTSEAHSGSNSTSYSFGSSDGTTSYSGEGSSEWSPTPSSSTYTWAQGARGGPCRR